MFFLCFGSEKKQNLMREAEKNTHELFLSKFAFSYARAGRKIK